METELRAQFYQNLLLKAGMDADQVEQVIQTHTLEQLHLIAQILPEWATVAPTTPVLAS
jgi:hypothetical protein